VFIQGQLQPADLFNAQRRDFAGQGLEDADFDRFFRADGNAAEGVAAGEFSLFPVAGGKQEKKEEAQKSISVSVLRHGGILALMVIVPGSEARRAEKEKSLLVEYPTGRAGGRKNMRVLARSAGSTPPSKTGRGRGSGADREKMRGRAIDRYAEGERL
jgi:hypothetical protein